MLNSLLLMLLPLHVFHPPSPPAAQRVMVIAHRGANAFAPENTLAAFRKAIRLGCDYVEMDVRQTRDGALVLMHDRTVDRTTDGSGSVAELSLAQIRALDAGKKRGPVWAGEIVPTFEEALAACRGKIGIYVDWKECPAEALIAVIERHRMQDHVVVYGPVERLRELRKLRPAMRIMPDHPGTLEGITALARDLKPETMDGNLRDWTPEQVNAAHSANCQVWVDNLGENDTEAGFRRALEMGVDAIQTDHPDRLLAFLKARWRR